MTSDADWDWTVTNRALRGMIEAQSTVKTVTKVRVAWVRSDPQAGKRTWRGRLYYVTT